MLSLLAYLQIFLAAGGSGQKYDDAFAEDLALAKQISDTGALLRLVAAYGIMREDRVSLQ